MKSFLPWLVALALFGVAAFFFSTNRKLESETASLRETAAKVESLRSELDQLKTSGSPAQAEQIAQLRKDNQELNKLRNDVRQLRDDKQQLSQQTQQAQAQIRAAQNQVQTLSTNLQAAQLADAQRRFAERYGRPATGEADPVAACINNLRQIDGTKQQWALENNFSGDIKKLAGGENKYRLRVGNHRVLFRLAGNQIQVYAVKDRKEAYE